MQFNKTEITTAFSHSQTIRYKINELFKEHADNYNLTVPQLLIIMSVGNKEVQNVKDIAQRFMMQPTNTSSLCKRLDDIGLLHRERDTEDVRVVNLFLTDIGDQIYRDVASLLDSRMSDVATSEVNVHKIMDGLEEVEKLITLLGEKDE